MAVSRVARLRDLARGLVGCVRDVLARYGRLGGAQFAAAISYRALFSLVPLATFVATILAEILSSSGADREDVVSAIAGQFHLSPEGAANLEALIASVPSPWSVPGLVSLALALWGATGMMSAMQKTLAVVFDDGVSRSLIRGRLVSALLVLGALGLILLAVAVSMIENVVRRASESVGEALGWQPFGFGILLGVVVPAAVVFVVFALLYHYLPRHRPGRRASLLGGGVAALGHQAVQAGLGWYLSGPADLTAVYGSASAVFAFLLSVYLSASAFVLGATLTRALDGRRGGPTVSPRGKDAVSGSRHRPRV
jgi:membrane protein